MDDTNKLSIKPPHPEETEANNAPSEGLVLLTLGRFLVKSDNVVISQKAIRSNKMWELFKFLLAHRGRYLTPEYILDNLWPEKEYTTPRSAFRVQITRMKKAIGEELFADDKMQLTFSHGCYCLDIDPACHLDINVLEDLSQKASELASCDPQEAIHTYLQAIELYKGDFFPNISYHGWVLPFRNYYRRLFLMNVLELIKLLNKAGLNAQIARVCEKALFIELFEEDIHLRYLEALLEEGKDKQALAHYQYITSLMYREIGAKPSEAMKKIYRRIKADTETIETDLSRFQEALQEQEKMEGALLCEPESFRFLCKLEARWMQRYSQEVLLGLLTVTGRDHKQPEPEAITKSMSHLKKILFNKLRKGDVISQWNETQFIMMLPGLTPASGHEVMQRIKSEFTRQFSQNEITVKENMQPLNPKTS